MFILSWAVWGRGDVLAGGLFYNARKIIGNIITLLLSDYFILINSEIFVELENIQEMSGSRKK